MRRSFAVATLVLVAGGCAAANRTELVDPGQPSLRAAAECARETLVTAGYSIAPATEPSQSSSTTVLGVLRDYTIRPTDDVLRDSPTAPRPRATDSKSDEFTVDRVSVALSRDDAGKVRIWTDAAVADYTKGKYIARPASQRGLSAASAVKACATPTVAAE